MDVYQKLPEDIQHKIFIFFVHPTAKIIKIHNSTRGKLMDDIRNFSSSLKHLYKLPFAKDHDGVYGRARLLNSLWWAAKLETGNYYEIWERMFRIKNRQKARWWIRSRYAIHPHQFQINSLWAVFTKKERNAFLGKPHHLYR